jgi:hypothetical protein
MKIVLNWLKKLFDILNYHNQLLIEHTDLEYTIHHMRHRL